MKRTRKRENGSALVLVTIAMTAILGLAALAIDVGAMLTARTQLQNAADSAALAGASGLIISEETATNRAILFASMNDCMNQPVSINSSNVTFPTGSRVRVQTNRQMGLFFARVLGIETAMIRAVAVAEIGSLSGTRGLKPWAIPDLNYTYGEQAILKIGSLGGPGTNPGFYYAVNFPPLNRGTPVPGAQVYRDNIMNGSQDPIYIGDELQVEPGNMVGPTQQGVNDLLSQDPNAYWDEGAQAIAGSDFPEYSSPRVCKVSMFDPAFPPDSGRNSVIVVKLAAFFVEGIQGRNVMGRFLQITTGGVWGPGPSDLMGVKLVQ